MTRAPAQLPSRRAAPAEMRSTASTNIVQNATGLAVRIREYEALPEASSPAPPITRSTTPAIRTVAPIRWWSL